MTDRKAGDEHMGAFVYCTQHVRPHTTGWCHVAGEDKIRLAAAEWMESYAECRRIGLDFGTTLDMSDADRERHRLMMPLAAACQQRHYRSWLTPQPYRRERDRILRRLAEIRGAA